MQIFPLSQRETIGELMDAPDVAPADHRHALAGLARINKSSRAAAIIAGPILAMVRREGLRKVTILDVACGGGDVPVAVASRLQRAGVDVTLTLMDRSGTALKQADELAAREGIAATCVEGEAPGRLPDGEFDVVTNSLFLHHLTSQQAVETLAQMHARAQRMVVVSDLRRSVAAWILAWTVCRILTRSPIVHHDGPASVRCAWTIPEMRKMCGYTAMADARLRKCWPMRMLLVWEKGSAHA